MDVVEDVVVENEEMSRARRYRRKVVTQEKKTGRKTHTV